MVLSQDNTKLYSELPHLPKDLNIAVMLSSDRKIKPTNNTMNSTLIEKGLKKFLDFWLESTHNILTILTSRNTYFIQTEEFEQRINNLPEY